MHPDSVLPPYRRASGLAVPGLASTSASHRLLSSWEGAFTDALERASGAAEAGEIAWENKQLDAAALYAWTLASLLKEQAAIETAAQNALKQLGFTDEPLTPADLSSAKEALKTGFSQDFIDEMTHAGFTTADLEQLRQEVLALRELPAGSSIANLVTGSAVPRPEVSDLAWFDSFSSASDGNNGGSLTPPPPPPVTKWRLLAGAAVLIVIMGVVLLVVLRRRSRV